MPTPVICSVARTPIGRFMGAFSSLSAVDLGVVAVSGVLERVGLDAASGLVDEVIMGQVLQAGAGQNPARQVALGAGLPVSTPAMTVNKVCGSSLKAVMLAATAIRAGEHRCIVAGGMESMTNAPQLLMGQRRGTKMGDSTLVDSMIHDGLWDVYNDMHMGNTGEVVSEEFSITREGMDAFAAQSQQRAATAQAEGWFAWETVPVQVPQRRGGPVTVLADEGVRADTTAEGLARLRPVFDREGKVTAGNASTLNDGAAAVLVADADLAAEMGWEVIAEIVDQTTSGVAPERVMAAPIPAVRTLLERQGARRLGRRRVRAQRGLRGRFLRRGPRPWHPQRPLQPPRRCGQPRPPAGCFRCPLPHHHDWRDASYRREERHRHAVLGRRQRRRHARAPPVRA